MLRFSSRPIPTRPVSLVRSLKQDHKASANPSWDVQNTPQDPRPAWAFKASRLGNLLIIPTAILYAVFYADWGEKEHVFSPARRWLERRKASFFSLSPAERELTGVVDDAKVSTPQGEDEPHKESS